jgi:hypothetical protein
MIFNITDLKKKMAEDLYNISEYGHPSYTAFETVLSKCQKFELVIDVVPGRLLSLATGKHGYKLDAYVLQLAEGADPMADDYDADRIADVDGRYCRTKGDLFEEIRDLINDAKDNVIARIAKK